MSRTRLSGIVTLALAAVLLAGAPAGAQVLVQCPGDLNGDSVPDPYLLKNNGTPSNRPNPDYDPNVQCMHLSGGDGFSVMADGKLQYIFSFADLTGIGDENDNGDISDDIMSAGALAAAWPAPVIVGDQGSRYYLNLTNVGMLIRPDLFDPHTVHFHGFPQSSTVFDGLPESGLSINMGATLTYFYDLVEPGTYMYHCHVEATEHMQMGMLGNLYVRPAQNRLPDGTMLSAYIHNNPDYNAVPGLDDPLVGDKYAYNDGDGSTLYDVEYPLQLGSFDPEFHDASYTVQPLPFAMMWDRYPMINGRGYPDTVNPNALPAPPESGVESQVESSLITASKGQKILLRLSNLNITTVHTLSSPSIPMKVVGVDAKELRNAAGPLHYDTNSVTMGGGMSYDVILDTADVAAGTYYLYAANLNHLSNYNEDFGGMMTEIVIAP